MLDKKTTEVLKTLGKLSADCAYKVITLDEILTALNSKAYDMDSIKNTVDYLSKQEYIMIKFEEEMTICYSLLPKARIYLETETTKKRVEKKPSPIGWVMLGALMSGVCALIGNLILYYFVI